MWTMAAYMQTRSYRPPGTKCAFIEWTQWTVAMAMHMTTAPQILTSVLLLRPGRRAEYCDKHVCFSCPFVCLYASISPELQVQLYQILEGVTDGRVLAVLRYVMYFRLYEWRHVCYTVARNRRRGKGVDSKWLIRGQHGFDNAECT